MLNINLMHSQGFHSQCSLPTRVACLKKTKMRQGARLDGTLIKVALTICNFYMPMDHGSFVRMLVYLRSRQSINPPTRFPFSHLVNPTEIICPENKRDETKCLYQAILVK